MRLPVLLILLACASPAAAVGPGDLPLRDGPVQVETVIDGDTVSLTDRRQVRLVGIQAPKLPLGRRGFRQWPLADEAKQALEGMVGGQTVTLGHGGQSMDRHGRLLAHLFLADGTWIQGRMLAKGMARVYTFPDNQALAAEMLALEAEARAAREGLWSHPFYRVRTDEDVAEALEGFHLVEGRVLDVAESGGRVYLNFGRDWKTDFTVMIARQDKRTFRDAGFDVGCLEGRRIRVRGWVREYNGPLVEASHPEQIEVLE